MRSAYLLSAATLVLGFLLSGCTVRHGSFTVLSNKLVSTKDFDLSTADRVKGVTGRDTAHMIILFPTNGITLEDAVDDALRKGKGDLLTDAVVHSWSWYIPYIYGNMGWEVTGDVVKTRR